MNEDETILDWAQRNQRQLTIAVLVASALVGGTWLYVRTGEIKETRAAESLVAGESAFSAGNYDLAKTELERTLTRYAGTSGGTQAALLYAQISFETGTAADGLAKLQTAGRKAPAHLKAAVKAMQATGASVEGKPAEAATLFEEAAGAAEFESEAEQYRMEAARMHVAAGNVAAAKTIYETIADREDSANAGEARVRLGELAGKA